MRRAVAAVLAGVVTLSGCSLFPTPHSTLSTPTGESVATDLQPFYDQVLEWELCGEGMQCTVAEAPLDWSDPARATIELSLVRQWSTGGEPAGSLLVNPGGPGASGYDLIHNSVDFAVTEALQARFDIVGFDPRGVNRSTPVSCHDDPATLDAYLFDIAPGEPGTDPWLDTLEASSAAFGQDCLEHSGELLGYVDTVSAARDLDLLRAILGDEKLNYLGYSYGTYLGATYAELYPEHTGRLVFDGALDPTTSRVDVNAVQAGGFESALTAFMADCIGAEGCPFTGTPATAMAKVADLIERLEASPIRSPDGRHLGAGSFVTAIVLPLYNEDSWPYLREVIASVLQGDAELAFSVVDSQYSRTPSGTYSDNSIEARIAINCLDYPRDTDRAAWRAEAATLAEVAPVFGSQFAWGGTSCADWPFPPGRERAPISAAGSADILVVGTTNDPATPYAWSVSLAEQLENGHLVTREGEGHTGYNKGNACVNSTVDDYFLDGVVPASDPDC